MDDGWGNFIQFDKKNDIDDVITTNARRRRREQAGRKTDVGKKLYGNDEIVDENTGATTANHKI